MYYVGADGSKEFKWWYDTLLDLRCVVGKLATSQGPTLRCVPHAPVITSHYIDAQCTQPISIKAECAQKEIKFISTMPPGGVCEENIKFHRILGEIQNLNTWYVKSANGCSPEVPSLSGVKYYETGPAIQLTDLVEFTEEVEP